MRGFTALSETLDPEVLAGLMNDLWTSLDAVIAEFGGRIDKHMGDAVMALWGAEGSQEDDVERAVRAGLALQDAVAAFGEEAGHQLAMRVGINTGQALVGAVGSNSELTAMGDTVNVASRLEHAAPVGGVLVSHDTYRHVRGVFDVEALAPLEVRGRLETVQTYVVLRDKPRAFRIASRGIEGVETPTVGRDAELSRLHAEYEAAAGGGSRSVLVVGDAGVGKSRVLFELESWIELRPESVWLLRGRALRSRQGVAHGLWRDVLAQRFGVLDSDTSAVVTNKLQAGFAGFLGSAEAIAVGQWLGFDLGDSAGLLVAEGMEATARAHLVHWLGSLAADEPAVILLEDLHWADDESLHLLVELVARLPDARLLVVGLTRPDLAERHPEWFSDTSMVRRIDLAPLQPDATADLVRLVLQYADTVPDELVELIVGRCDGNPFFVEELVKMLIDDLVIHTDAADGRWSIDVERLAVSRVPATLSGVLQARLDHLEPDELNTLQCAAVVGRVFWDTSVAALDDGATIERIRSSLDVARARELVFRRHESVFAGSDELIFKHALLRDVTYETVLLRDRQRLHSRAAAWLTSVAGDRLAEYLDTVGHHHRLAGEHVAAAERFHEAARADLGRGLATSARRLVEQAIEQWTLSEATVPCNAYIVLGESLRRLGDLDAAEATLAASTDAITLGERAEALYAASRLAVDRGDAIRERALLDEAADLDLAAWPEMRIRIDYGLAWWEVGHGDLDTARGYAEPALALAEQTGDTEGLIETHNVLGAIAESACDLPGAERHALTCLQLARQIGDVHGEATARGRLGIAAHLRGDAEGSVDDYAGAAAHYEAAAALYRQLGYPLLVAIAMSNLAQARLRLGDRTGSRAAGHEAMADLAELRATSPLIFCLLVEADWRLTAGDTERALALLGLVRAHPVALNNDHDEIERIVSRTSLDRVVIERGMQAGTGLDLYAVVADLLAEAPDGEATTTVTGPGDRS